MATDMTSLMQHPVIDVTTDSTDAVSTEENASSLFSTAAYHSAGTSEGGVTNDVPLYELIAYICIGTVGILDNGLVIAVLCSSRTIRRKVINIFLINQSLLDLVTSLLVAVSANNDQHSGGHSGLGGELFCRIWVFKIPMWAAFMSSTYNLVAVTLERYLEVCHPIWHKLNVNQTRALVVIVVVWLIGPAENFLVNGITSEVRDGYCYQMVNWPAPWVGQFTGVFIVIIEFFIPLCIMIFAYSRMAVAMKTRVAPVVSSDGNADPAAKRREEKMMRIRKNILKTLILVCACFILCWIWNQVYFLLFNLHVHRNLHSPFFHFTVYAAFVNCLINPLIYAAQYRDFQYQFRRLVGWKKKEEAGSNAETTAGGDTMATE